jgi:hypothetical protein
MVPCGIVKKLAEPLAHAQGSVSVHGFTKNVFSSKGDLAEIVTGLLIKVIEPNL